MIALIIIHLVDRTSADENRVKPKFPFCQTDFPGPWLIEEGGARRWLRLPKQRLRSDSLPAPCLNSMSSRMRLFRPRRRAAQKPAVARTAPNKSSTSSTPRHITDKSDTCISRARHEVSNIPPCRFCQSVCLYHHSIPISASHLSLPRCSEATRTKQRTPLHDCELWVAIFRSPESRNPRFWVEGNARNLRPLVALRYCYVRSARRVPENQRANDVDHRPSRKLRITDPQSRPAMVRQDYVSFTLSLCTLRGFLRRCSDSPMHSARVRRQVKTLLSR